MVKYGSYKDDPLYLIDVAGKEAAADGVTALELRRAAELGYLALSSTVSVIIGHDVESHSAELKELGRIAAKMRIPNMVADYTRLRGYLHGKTFHNAKHGTQQDVVYALGQTALLIGQMLSKRELNK